MPPRFEVYRAVSQQIRATFARYTSLVQPPSLGEAYFDVTAPLRDPGSATAICFTSGLGPGMTGGWWRITGTGRLAPTQPRVDLLLWEKVAPALEPSTSYKPRTAGMARPHGP